MVPYFVSQYTSNPYKFVKSAFAVFPVITLVLGLSLFIGVVSSHSISFY